METRPGTGTEVVERTDARLARPWNVVDDDPVNLMVYVTRIFMQVFGYPRPKAETHMLEVHHQGRSIVWTGDREQAELYVLKLRSAALRTTMEQVEA